MSVPGYSGGGGAAAGVTSFNTRQGAVVLGKADVTATGLTAADVGADAAGADLVKAQNLADVANVQTAMTNIRPRLAAGALPTIAPANGVGIQVDVAHDRMFTAVVTDAGAATGTLLVGVSPDNVTYTNVANWVAHSANEAGRVTVFVPAGWYVKLTVANVAALANMPYW